MVEGLEKGQLSELDAKGFVPDEVRNAFFRKLRMKNENRSCFECQNRNPTWISLTYGVYLCLECSGEHRRKGVHISFVRSVELDKFSPDQMVRMGVGGNAKAWTYFKNVGMGKTSDSGRAVDYSSKVAVKYKAQLDKEASEAGAKLGVATRDSAPGAAAPAAEEAPAPKAPEPVVDELAADFGFSDLTTTAPRGSTSSQPRGSTASTVGASTPKAQAKPATVVLRKSTADFTPVAAKPAPKEETPVIKPSGFASSKHLAKEIDFDFDFDDLEAEAAKPAPAPPPKAAAPAPAPSVAAPPAATSMAPVRTASAPDTGDQGVDNKYAKSKSISSDDFFGDLESETAQARMDRDNRYNKFAGAGAISSSSFFNDGEEERSPGNDEDWKSRGSELAKAGITKGAELLSTYLNKVRN